MKVSPFMHEDGIIRVGGRLTSARHLAFEIRCPIVPPKENPALERLLVHTHVHDLNHVGGHKALGAEINRKFYSPALITAACRIEQKCVQCKRVKGQKIAPKMATLPDHRIPQDVTDLETKKKKKLEYLK